MAEDPVADPYRSCEQRCSHDLGNGVLLRELLGGDGPNPPGHWLVSLAPHPSRSWLEAPGVGR
ncbi:MAG TPA: hypothetical protein VMX37_03830 [Acidimicrobiia bacterium]|nr:hypothetical protein [Acidimicrobiia bacterium]